MEKQETNRKRKRRQINEEDGINEIVDEEKMVKTSNGKAMDYFRFIYFSPIINIIIYSSLHFCEEKLEDELLVKLLQNGPKYAQRESMELPIGLKQYYGEEGIFTKWGHPNSTVLKSNLIIILCNLV